SSRLPTYDRLWNKIRKIQKEKGITDSELANLFGLSKRTLSRYDKSACPLTLEKLSNFLESIGGSIEIDC
ncbi:XRE family transcriptional regulator, partial [Ruminococcus sp.]|uniref:XRE family transcriptional regulator n=1 Tax=Ruminococcus sp. TaxID=41978 RepID=UPI0025E2B4BC